MLRGANLKPGEQVGEWTVEGPLGEGATASVWRVRRGEQLAALKVLHGVDTALQARMRREARLMLGLSHPNVVEALALLEVNGQPALLMSLVEGPSLAERLMDGQPTLAEAEAVFSDILEGVGAAHAAGLVHRDLKPANVLLDGLTARVADFGLARGDGDASLTRTGALMGTPAYMAPEQVRNPRAAGPRADVFALGAILYELVCGRRPFEGAELLSLIAAAAEGRYPAPEALVPGLPERVVLAIRGALTPDPSARIPDCEVLGAVLRGEQVWTVAAPSLSETWVPDGPVDPEPFVGRARELAQLSALVAVKPTALVGTGGVGKTRLARRLMWVEPAPGGSWLCDLSARDGAQGVMVEVALALGITVPDQGASERIGEALRGRGPCLLVLDNAERVIDDAAALVAQWAAQAPEARFLVTSRVRPTGLAVMQLDALSPAEAVALFVDRARAARAGFAPDEATLGHIRSLVQRLDHLPLAIELAAARTRVMDPAAILSRLESRFRVLRARGESRWDTLEAAIAWSWDGLEGWEREALSQLSVFRAAFEMDAAEAVLDGDFWAEDALEALQNHSLLQARVGDGAPRFRLLESVRAFAAAQRQGDGAIRRHADWFAAICEPAALRALLEGGEAAKRTLEELDLELLGALEGALGRGWLMAAQPLALGLVELLLHRGPLSAAQEVMERMLVQPALTGAARGRMLAERVRILHYRGELGDHAVELEEALTLARGAGDRSLEGRVLTYRVKEHIRGGAYTAALADADDAISLFQGSGLAYWECSALYIKGHTLVVMGEHEAAEALLLRVLTAARACGARRYEAGTLGYLGNLAVIATRPAEALDRFEQAIALAREMRWRDGLATFLSNRGIAYLGQRRYPEALATLEEALTLARELGDLKQEAYCLGQLGNVRGYMGLWAAARADLEAALRVSQRSGEAQREARLLSHLGAILLEMDRPRDAASRAARAHTALTACNDAVFLPINRLLQGQCARALGELSQSRALLLEAQEHGEDDYRHGAALELAALALLEGDAEGARAQAEALREAFSAMISGEFWRIRALALAGQAALALGDGAGAREALNRAREVAARAEPPPGGVPRRALDALEAALTG